MTAFDPYHRWLGIPPEEQPPNHYRLLGLVQYESDPEVIENAANQRMAHLRSFQAGRHAADSQRLLNEVAAARICLLNADKKAAYDDELRASEIPPATPPTPSEVPPPVVPPQSAQPISSPPIPSIEVKEDETWLDAHLHGHHGHHDPHTDSRFSRGTLFALAGSGAALALVILLALLLRSGSSTQATLVFELAGADREELRLSIDDMERKLPPSGPLEFTCEPGSHEIIAGRPGYPPFVTEVTLEARERLTLVPKWGQPTELVLAWPETDREGAKLFLDGRHQEFAIADSATPDMIVLPIAPGKRVVRIERPGFEPFEIELDLKVAESTEVAPTFRKADAAAQGTDMAEKSEPGQEPEPSTPQTPSSDTTPVASQDPPEPEPTTPDAAAGLHPIPSADEQASALLRVDEAFNVEQADTREKKAELAKRLLDTSAKARETPLDQFGLLDRGQQLAIAAEDVPLALRLIAAKGDAFDIDLLSEQASVLSQIAESALEVGLVASLVDEGWKIFDSAVAAERFDIADRSINALHTKIDQEPWQPHAEQISDRHKEWQAIRKALASLEANPDDPNANAIVGRWYLDIGEYEKAFPYMAKIQHEAISSLAKAELTPPDVAEEQATLGDRWWDQAESATDSALKKAFRARAIHWYKQARPKLNSVVLSEKIANRLGEVVASPPGTAAPVSTVVYPLPDGKAITKDKWEDLLAAMNQLRDVTRGQWKRQGNVFTSVTPRSTLMFPVAIQGDYELEFQFSHAGGTPEGLSVTIPVGSRTCDIFFPYNTRQDILANVNGQPFVATVPRLTPGRLITAKISVTSQGLQKHINVSVNGGPFFQWQGTEASLSGTGTGQLPRMNQPGLMNIRDNYALHGARFRLLDGEARLLTSEELPPRPCLLTGDVGYYLGTVFQEFAPKDSALVGLRYAPGGQGVGNLQPVYRTQAGQLQDGPWVGGMVQPAGSVIAKDGFTIGALDVETQNGYLTGVTVRFYRLGEDGLDLSDSYDSPLIGQPGSDGVSVVETRGRPATGVHGLWNPGQIASLGLVTARPAEEKLWKSSPGGRSSYLPLLDLDPIQSTVGQMRFARRLGIGTTDPQAWPVIDEDSQNCPEFLYAPAPSRYIWKLTPATMKSFSAIGYCVEGRPVQFLVLVDGRTIHDSGEVHLARIKADLPPGEQLELQIHTLGNGTLAESFWLFPRVHARSAETVKSIDEKTGKGSMLVNRPPVSRAVSPRPKSHTFLPPVYPVSGRCREFLYAQPPSRVVYRVPAGAKRFSAVGYCVSSKTVRFRVAVNGKEAYTSGPLGIERIQVSLSRQAKTIELWTDTLPDSRVSSADISFWCFPRFTK